MTLFQIVTLENPVKFTPKAKSLWPEIKEQILDVSVYRFLKESLEGIEIGLSLGKGDENPYFVELCHRDLD